MQRYLIIGNGIAGMTAAETIRENDPTGHITLVTDEETPFYNRIRLCDCISGDLPLSELTGVPQNWHEAKGITLKVTTPITRLDPSMGIAVTGKGEHLPWDKVLIATGGSPRIPEIKGVEKKGVVTLRTLADARTILASPSKAQEVVIIGGGLLGLEAGHALTKRGKRVTIIENAHRILPRQLDAHGADLLMKKIEGRGLRLHTGVAVTEITGKAQATGVVLTSGTTIPADMILISAGIRPNTHLAETAGITAPHGIPVDTAMETPHRGIFAAGDCAAFNDTIHGIWATGMEQGRIAGLNMSGQSARYLEPNISTILKVTGINLASAGDVDAKGEHDSIVHTAKGIYKKAVFHGDRLAGCQMVGNMDQFNVIREYILAHHPLSPSQRREVARIIAIEGADASKKATSVCTVCGYLHEGSLPLERCPQCGAPPETFEIVAEEKESSAWVCTVCGYTYKGENAPTVCPQCNASRENFQRQTKKEPRSGQIIIPRVKNKEIPLDIRERLYAQFAAECTEVGICLAMGRQADREGYPEVANALKRIALEEADHAATFAALLGGTI